MPIKFTLVIFLSMIVFKTYSQDELRFVKMDKSIDRQLLLEARDIMNILKIKVRSTLRFDGQIELSIKKGSHYLDASFNNNFGNDFLAEYDVNRVYKAPFLIITELCLNISNKTKDTTVFYYTRARETIVHELTHYLQASFDMTKVDPKSNLKGYISEPTEFEAFSVGAYYFLQHTNKNELTRIMGLNIGLTDKCKILINTFYKLIYPRIDYIFKV